MTPADARQECLFWSRVARNNTLSDTSLLALVAWRAAEAYAVALEMATAAEHGEYRGPHSKLLTQPARPPRVRTEPVEESTPGGATDSSHHMAVGSAATLRREPSSDTGFVAYQRERHPAALPTHADAAHEDARPR